MAETTASTDLGKTFTLDDLKRMERELAAMPKPPWTLIAPDGRAWQEADPEALLRVLAVYALSPLCRTPMSNDAEKTKEKPLKSTA